jgi:uncharacterized C2H2 Zn-finger protein
MHQKLDVFGQDIPVVMVYQYVTTTNHWKFVSYRCKLCDKALKLTNSVVRHVDKCKILNTTKEDKKMPIQVVTQNGQRMYRYGDSGKLYKDRKDAEKQAQAIHASGYKEKKDMEKK